MIVAHVSDLHLDLCDSLVPGHGHGALSGEALAMADLLVGEPGPVGHPTMDRIALRDPVGARGSGVDTAVAGRAGGGAGARGVGAGAGVARAATGPAAAERVPYPGLRPWRAPGPQCPYRERPVPRT